MFKISFKVSIVSILLFSMTSAFCSSPAKPKIPYYRLSFLGLSTLATAAAFAATVYCSNNNTPGNIARTAGVGALTGLFAGGAGLNFYNILSKNNHKRSTAAQKMLPRTVACITALSPFIVGTALGLYNRNATFGTQLQSIAIPSLTCAGGLSAYARFQNKKTKNRA